MITDFILSAIFGGINALLSLVPAVSLPTLDPNGSSFMTSVSEMNAVIPIGAMLICLGAFLAIKIGLQGWDFVVFVYHQFWGGD